MTDRESLKTAVDIIIAAGEHDDEAAHSAEDRLHLQLIKAFCPKWVQAEVQRLSDAEFGRLCA